jgi:phosphoglycerate dehydrogenase-like enzyme
VSLSLALMLAGARRLHHLARERSWSTPSPQSLSGSTVAIVGCGGIGRELLRMLQPFGVRVLAITRSGTPIPGTEVTATPDQLLEIVAEADFVVLAAPSTPNTQSLIGHAELAAMKPTSWLFNIARGELIDTGALVEALRAQDIGGAALDVTDPEPLPDAHPLWQEPNALITPHSANPLSLRLPRYAERVRRNVERYIAAEPLEGVVDLEAGY